MSSDPAYRPVGCALHSELELAIMRRQRLTLDTPEGAVTGLPTDVRIRDGAEYLLLQVQTSECWLRLDRIRSWVVVS
jgi:Rho-binding antiterminator